MQHSAPRVQRAVWIASEDMNLITWLGKIFREQAPVIAITSGPNFFSDIPLLWILGCNYNCQLEACLKTFCLANPWSGVPIMIARPLLIRDCCHYYPEYLISRVGYPTSDSSEDDHNETSAWSRIPLKHRAYVHPLDPVLPILRIQEHVLDCKGKVSRCSQLGAISNLPLPTLSKRFKKMSGSTLKQFTNRIRLFGALWDLIWTSKPIKCIALEFGYRPTSFSLSFHEAFRTWPSEARISAQKCFRARANTMF